MERGTNKNKWTNIALLITMFIAVGSFVYGVLNFFNILANDQTRIVLAIIIALILGLIIYFKKEKRRDKSVKK